MSSWDVLERHFDGLTAAEVNDELASIPARGATPTSAAATAYLAEHGGPDLNGDARPGSIQRRRALTATRTLIEVLNSAMTPDQVAEALGISRSRVSHRISEGTLWSFTIHGRRHLPRWQLATDSDGGADSDGKAHVIPGLPTIVPAIPTSVHPAALDALMTNPHEAFDGHSPVEWLTSGGDSSAVADWLTGMAHG